MSTRPPKRIEPTAEEAKRAKHQAWVNEQWRRHRICCAIAPQLGRTKEEMLMLEIFAMQGPRDETAFRASQLQTLETYMGCIWQRFSKLNGAYAYKIDPEGEGRIAEAFDTIREVAAECRVVRDSKAAAELAFIRHAIDGADNQPLQSFIKQVTRRPKKRAT